MVRGKFFRAEVAEGSADALGWAVIDGTPVTLGAEVAEGSADALGSTDVDGPTDVDGTAVKLGTEVVEGLAEALGIWVTWYRMEKRRLVFILNEYSNTIRLLLSQIFGIRLSKAMHN